MNDRFFADLEESPNVASSLGAIAPSLNTHPDVFSYNSQPLAVAKEYFGIQGMDDFPELVGTRQVSAMTSIAGLEETDITFLAGSGLHVAVFCLRHGFGWRRWVRRCVT